MTDKVYLDMEIKGDKGSGRISLGLFGSVAPKAVENFKSLCACDKGIGSITGKPFCYRGSPIHRVVTDFGFKVVTFRTAMELEVNPSTRLDSLKTKAFKCSTIVRDSCPWPTRKVEIRMDHNSLLEQFQVCGWTERILSLATSWTEWMWYNAVAKKGTYGGQPTAKITVVDSGVLPVEEADRKKVPVPSKSSLSL